MPHTALILKQASADSVVGAAVPTITVFLRFLETVIADCFRLHTGEKLEPGIESKVYEPVISESCPADLVLQIAAWWSPERTAKFPLIAQSIKHVLETGYAAVELPVRVEVFINAIGAPEPA